MMKAPALLLAALLAVTCPLWAAKTTDAIALTVKGFDIPIKVVAPEEGTGPFPVVYHVHGGGWNGGTDTSVPGASIYPGFEFLTDQLGVIHVALAYRCKDQGSFWDALEDLRASIKWFEARGDTFNADLTRVGFSGGSAGTPLSALLAQQTPASKTYVGLFGVYNLLDNDESLFPNEEACAEYELASESQKRQASVYHNLRAQPPATLLFHGAHDILTHPTQSLRYAEHLQQQGAEAEAIVYPDVNHGYFSERYPIEFKDSALRIARLYVNHLGVAPSRLEGLGSAIDERVAGNFPKQTIEPHELLGSWRNKNETFEFTAEGHGNHTIQKNKTQPFSYYLESGVIHLTDQDGTVTKLYLQVNGRALYKIPENDVRRTAQRVHFAKQRNSGGG